ncbi:DUF305 domain-containing protein [Massilia sp. CT11-108]|jgi:hypothetical protein|uniref:DUF305 domain-containing protein n=1 Tax=Massilia sp. CT11-108 TaxID=3393900 RepID=UPI0039A6DE99
MATYTRFGWMIACSTLVMFDLMYLNTYEIAHVHFSQTRAGMALVMGAAMAIVMLGFILGMYEDRRCNVAIFVGACVIFAVSLWFVRSQATVDDVSYMRAMIPPHSIAIMTSERVRMRDARVRELTDGIAATQRKEIAETEALIADIERRGPQH